MKRPRSFVRVTKRVGFWPEENFLAVARADSQIRGIRVATAKWWAVQLTFLLAVCVAQADSKLGDFTITRWTRENGLPGNSVTCLVQTRDGFLWVGTTTGLARFDGVKFVPLKFPVHSARL